MSGRLEGKVAFITGAASGIGRACATLFASEGARLVVVDIDEQGLAAIRDELERSGVDCLALAGDVTRRERVEAMVAETVARFARLDVLVNSAGITRRHVPADADFEQAWDKVMAVNLKGTLLMCHAAV
ncbi:MAG: SDR family NAD(P)-dependent oxidoreductase, partial [Gammaproteobacteria bacterium]|nr:SDR family NAD(P)-dependent oxidoreductase [Gammaproteobacteria bacterium]